MGTAPLTSTSRPHHMISVPRPPPFLTAFLLPCVILNETEGQRTGRPGNEARELYHKDEEP